MNARFEVSGSAEVLSVENQEARLAALALASCLVLSRYYIAQCCIAATKVGVQVLREWGIEARPLLVGVTARCPSTAFSPAYEVIIDHRSSKKCGGPGLSGHLVIAGRVGAKEFLLDLSAYQMDRPERGLHVPRGIYVAVDKLSLPLAVDTGDSQSVVTYERHRSPKHSRWRDTPDWLLPNEMYKNAFSAACNDLRRLVPGYLAAAAVGWR